MQRAMFSLQVAKDSSVEKLIGRLKEWYFEKEGNCTEKLKALNFSDSFFHSMPCKCQSVPGVNRPSVIIGSADIVC